MATASDSSPAPSSNHWQRMRRRFRGGLVIAMGCMAIAAPFVAGSLGLFLTGLLLIVCGGLEMLETFWSGDTSSTRWHYLSGEMSILAGIVLLNKPEWMLRAVALFLAIMFVVDGIGQGMACWRARKTGSGWVGLRIIGVGKVALAVMLVMRWPIADWPIVGVVVGMHMLTTGWSILLGRLLLPSAVLIGPDEHPDVQLQVPAHPALGALTSTVDAEYDSRRSSDARWCWVFIIVFLAIHIGRMRVYWDAVGMIDPLIAVAGDVAMSLVLAFGVLLPIRLGWRTLTRPLERRGWRRALARIDAGRVPGLMGRLSPWWLKGRLRFAGRLSRLRRSPRAALAWGLRAGLPVITVLVAINPLWGDNNYFFNTETWASGVWHRWAEARTDPWRAHMIRALQHHYSNVPEDRLLRLEPPGVGSDEDFRFIVIADTGDGGAAQHALRDQYIALGHRPEVTFLVVSSDVIYPDGAMRDYEARFYLPFKGFEKPIYALPGNHDWYGANEGFNANFLDAESARVCMQSRLDTDGRWTSSAQRRIDGYIQEAARLRKEFGVSTGHQKGPVFEGQTTHFALIAVDTGVLKAVDAAQWHWFNAALKRSRGKFRLVLLGHPLYTAGHYQGDPDKLQGEWAPSLGSPFGGEAEPFTAMHKLLKEEKVEVVMAGDMHYFEHYKESYKADGKEHTMHHFVNGGGGAYMVVGLPFDWPRHPDLPAWTYFPRKEAIITKLDAQTPFWKRPLWLWVKHFSGWPFSGYILSAAFDHNKAPFFQSFVEVQVLSSQKEVRFMPYGANGPLRWRDLENYEAWMPPGKTPDDRVDFSVPMPSQ